MYVSFRILDHDKTKNIANKSFQISITAFELHMVVVVVVEAEVVVVVVVVV